MQRRQRIGWAAGVCALALAGLSGGATADWPMARQNPQRTGAATGTSDITHPVAFWRYYLGGFIAQTNLVPYDVDGDGAAEIVVVTGGRAIAKELSDETIWETAALELTTLDGVADVDGDGVDELIVHSKNRVFIISLTDGSVKWAEPNGEMGTIGGVRIGDVNGDGVADLVIGECGCCSVRSETPGVVYSFADDLASPTLLWTFPFGSCGGSGSALTLADVDGAPGREVFLGTANALSVVNGATGLVMGSSAALGTWIMRSECIGVDLDGSGGQELICLLNSSLAPSTNQRRAFALRYNGAASPALEMLWSTALAPDDGELAWIDPIVDLDADGLMEVVASGKTSDGTWTTTVLAAESGAVLATLPNTIARGVADTTPGGELILITAMDTSLAGWRFQRTATTVASQLWTIPDVDLLGYQDPGRRMLTRLSARALTVDVGGYGRQDLITLTTVGPEKLVAYSTSLATPTVVGELVMPDDLELVSAWPTASALGLGRLAVLQNDGLVRVLEAGLVPLESPDDVVAPGLRFGGYYLAGGWRDLQSTMVAGTLSPGQPDSIIARDSRGAIVRLEAAHGSFAAPPRTEWTRTKSFSPSIVDNLVGDQPGVACFATKQPVTADPDHLLEVLTADGTPVWSVDVPKRPFNDLLVGSFSAPGARDLVFEWGDPGDTQVRKRAVSGASGMTLWESAALEAGSGRQPAGMAIGDWDADGIDDVFHQAMSTRVISGANGQELVNTGTGPSYFQPMLGNLDDDAASEVILQGGVAPAQAYDDDLATVLWTSSESDRPVPYGSLVTCPDGSKRFLAGSWLNPARLRLTTLSGADLGIESTLVLAGGGAYADEAAALADGKALSQLGSIAAHSNLRGTGQPIAMVGSGDGWLYGYEPCTGRLEIVYHAGAPVGAPIFGDTDGDGKDEILISTADGYLYALRNLTLAAPGYVWDTDPETGITDRDVNAVVTRDSLSARWRDVPGATSYEVTVVNLDEEYINTPFWTDVGLVTETTLTGLSLQDDAAYRFAVRAIAADGRSVDTVSNGVVVRFPNEVDRGDAGPDAGPAAVGCGCSSDAPPGGRLDFVLLLMLVVTGLRRRVR